MLLNGDPSASKDVCGCDEDDLDGEEECAEIPTVSGSAILTWAEVTTSHASLPPGSPIVDFTMIPTLVIIDEDNEEVGHGVVRYYEVVVEVDETDFKSTSIVPPNRTFWEIPEAFLELFDEFKYEVLVRTNVIGEDGKVLEGEIDGEEGPLPGNVSALESCFKVIPPPPPPV